MVLATKGISTPAMVDCFLEGYCAAARRVGGRFLRLPSGRLASWGSRGVGGAAVRGGGAALNASV